MKIRNSITQALLAGFVPLYQYYWMIVTSGDVERSRNIKAPHIALPIVNVLLVFVAILALLLTLLSIGDSSNTFGNELLLIFFVASFSIVSIPLYYFLFSKQIEEAYGGILNKWLLILLLWLLAPIAVYLVQEEMNKSASSGSTNLQNPGSPIVGSQNNF